MPALALVLAERARRSHFGICKQLSYKAVVQSHVTVQKLWPPELRQRPKLLQTTDVGSESLQARSD